MKSLLQFLNEATITDLEIFLNDNGISVDDALAAIIKYNNSKKGNIKEFTKFFKSHGLTQLNWGRGNDAITQFINVFNRENKIDILIEVVENNGVISIDELKTSGNIYDYCKGFEDEAKIICSWLNGTNTPAGQGEILLKFLIKEASTPVEGDILIKPNKLMEVKASTIYGINKSGGQAAGQKGDIRNAWSIYQYLYENLTGDSKGNGGYDNFIYFQNTHGFNEFNELLKGLKNIDVRKITDVLTEAFLYQYRFIGEEPKNAAGIDGKTINELKDIMFNQLKTIFNEDNTISKNNEMTLINNIGALQLVLYSLIEEFEYFFCILYDKNIENESPNNGKYVFLTKEELFDFKKVLSHLSFGKFASTATKTQGRAGKIFVK